MCLRMEASASVFRDRGGHLFGRTSLGQLTFEAYLNDDGRRDALVVLRRATFPPPLRRLPGRSAERQDHPPGSTTELRKTRPIGNADVFKTWAVRQTISHCSEEQREEVPACRNTSATAPR